MTEIERFKTIQDGWGGTGAAETGFKALAGSLDCAPVLSCESTGASLGMTGGVYGYVDSCPRHAGTGV